MPKIRVEIEVPENCLYCRFFTMLTGRCDIFGEILKVDEKSITFEPCEQCKEAEVEE